MSDKIVTVKMVEKDPHGRTLREHSRGKGFVYEDGYVVTALHVIEPVQDGLSCEVHLPDGTVVKANKLDSSEPLDTAVLNVPDVSERTSAKKFAMAISDIEPVAPIPARIVLPDKIARGNVEKINKDSIQLTSEAIPSAVEDGASGAPMLLGETETVVGILTDHQNNIWKGSSISRIREILPSPPEPRNRRLKPMLRDFVWQHKKGILGLGVLGGALIFGLGKCAHFETPVAWIGLAQTILCMLALSVTFRVWKNSPGPDEETKARYSRSKLDFQPAFDSLNQFKWCWIVLLSSWAFLFTLLSFRDGLSPLGPTVMFFLTFFNNIGTLSMAVIYYVMQYISAPSADRTRDNRYSPTDSGTKIVGLSVIGFLFAAGMSAAHVGAYFSWDKTGVCGKGLELFSGALAGLIFASWIGKMDSKFIDANPSALGLLYLYAVIQPLWPYVADAQSETSLGTLLRMVLLTVSMSLKGLLIFFIFWIVRSGRLLFYFANVRRVYGLVAKDWKNLEQKEEALESNPLPLGGIAAVGLVFVACAGGFWIFHHVHKVALDGPWAATITWKDAATVRKLNPCPDFVYDPSLPPRSKGTIIVVNSTGHEPVIMSAWTFAPNGVFNDREAGNAVIHVIPKLESTPGESSSVTFRMQTVARVYVDCDHPRHAEIRKQKQFQVNFRMQLDNKAGTEGLSGWMQSLEDGNWKNVGEVTMSKLSPTEFNEIPQRGR